MGSMEGTVSSDPGPGPGGPSDTANAVGTDNGGATTDVISSSDPMQFTATDAKNLAIGLGEVAAFGVMTALSPAATLNMSGIIGGVSAAEQGLIASGGVFGSLLAGELAVGPTAISTAVVHGVNDLTVLGGQANAAFNQGLDTAVYGAADVLGTAGAASIGAMADVVATDPTATAFGTFAASGAPVTTDPVAAENAQFLLNLGFSPN